MQLDVVPISLEFHQDKKNKPFASFSEALDHYFAKEVNLIQEKETVAARKAREMERIVAEQEKTIKELSEQRQEEQKKGDAIYHQYQLIQGILAEMAKAKKSHSAKEIKKKLAGHKMIKEYNGKEGKVVLEL